MRRLIPAALILVILLAAAWHFRVLIGYTIVGAICLRILLAKHGLTARRSRSRNGSALPGWVDAISLAWIALQFGGKPSKREPVSSAPTARYKLRRGSQEDRFDTDPDWPFSPPGSY
jgi:hypothetical protein